MGTVKKPTIRPPSTGKAKPKPPVKPPAPAAEDFPPPPKEQGNFPKDHG